MERELGTEEIVPAFSRSVTVSCDKDIDGNVTHIRIGQVGMGNIIPFKEFPEEFIPRKRNKAFKRGKWTITWKTSQKEVCKYEFFKKEEQGRVFLATKLKETGEVFKFCFFQWEKKYYLFLRNGADRLISIPKLRKASIGD